MSQDSLARALTAVMVTGGVVGVDLHDARDAHHALRSLWASPAGREVCRHLAVIVATVPDPDVGLRVRGLTQALWAAVSMQYLEPVGGSSFLAVSDSAQVMAGRLVSDLSGDGRSAVAAAGQDWACRSTARNALPSSLALPPGT